MQIGGKSDRRMHFCFCLSRSQGLKVGGEGGPGRYLLHLTSQHGSIKEQILQHDFFSGEQVRPRAPRSRLFAREFRTDFAAVATPSTGGDLGGGPRRLQSLSTVGTAWNIEVRAPKVHRFLRSRTQILLRTACWDPSSRVG